MFDLLPDLFNLALGFLSHGPLLQPSQCLADLRQFARSEDDSIAVLAFKMRIKCDPTVGQLCPAATAGFCSLLPEIERFEIGRLSVHFSIHLRQDMALGEAARILASGNLLSGLCEKPARDGTVGVEGHVQLAKGGEEFLLFCLYGCNWSLRVSDSYLFLPTGYGAVVPLVHCGQNIAFFFADPMYALHSRGFVIAQTKALEVACFVSIVDSLERIFELETRIRSMNVVNVDLICNQSLALTYFILVVEPVWFPFFRGFPSLAS